jgi:hypothetical protein
MSETWKLDSDAINMQEKLSGNKKRYMLKLTQLNESLNSLSTLYAQKLPMTDIILSVGENLFDVHLKDHYSEILNEIDLPDLTLSVLMNMH